MKLLAIFIALQVMDFATTLVAIAMGGTEQNPLIGHFMAVGPVAGLVFSKVIVIGVAGLCFWGKKTRSIRLANVAFALIVAWNVTTIGRLALLV